MSLRYALLGLLADRPYNGWQLLKNFEGSLAYAWPALHSQIYPELARLREAGLIEQTGEGPRGSKEYSLTATGRAEIERWLRETTPSRNTRDERHCPDRQQRPVPIRRPLSDRVRGGSAAHPSPRGRVRP